MNRRGFTLVELLVSMTIFLIVTAIVVGGYLSILNVKQYVSTFRDTQQKVRTSTEILNRFAKQAEIATVSADQKSLVLQYSITSPADYVLYKYSFENRYNHDTLVRYKCLLPNIANFSCKDGSNVEHWEDTNNPPFDMLSGYMNVDLTTSSFVRSIDGFPPVIEYHVVGNTGAAGLGLGFDTFNLSQSMLLENIR